MKKIRVIFLGLMVVILTAGCGTKEEKTEDKEQKLVCTSTENDEGMTIEQVISMTYKNDKLKRMTMEINTKITDKDIQENWKLFKDTMDKDNEEFDKEGVSLKVKTDDKNYEYDTILDIDIDKASEEVLKEQGFEGLKDDNSTLKSSKESAEKDGATCRVE